MSTNIKQIIQQQYLMCAKDPVFFMRQYCYIQHPKQGKRQSIQRYTQI